MQASCWVLVKDRTPKMMDGYNCSERVLCFTDKHNYQWIAHFLDDGRADPNTFGPPTHWMDLPVSPMKS